MRRMLCLLVLMLYCAYGCVSADQPSTEIKAAGHGIGRVHGVHPSSGPVTGVPPVGAAGAIPGVPGAIPAVRHSTAAPGVKVPGSLPPGTGAPPGVSAVNQGYKPGKPGGESPENNHQHHPGVGVHEKANVTLANLLGISLVPGPSVPTTKNVGVSGFKNEETPDSSKPLSVCPATSNKSGVVIGGVPGANKVPCVPGVPGVPGTVGANSVTLGKDNGISVPKEKALDPTVHNVTHSNGAPLQSDHNAVPKEGDLQDHVDIKPAFTLPAPVAPNGTQAAAANRSEYTGVPEAVLHVGNGSSSAARARFSRPVTHAPDADSQSNTDSSDTSSTQSEANGHQAESSASSSPNEVSGAPA
ncbi:uncharacterized protein TM35_001391030, partial [Trypanosoma theileri]